MFLFLFFLEQISVVLEKVSLKGNLIFFSITDYFGKEGEREILINFS